jgi:hypothetical protein
VVATSGSRVRLSVDVTPELRRRVKIAAAERDQSTRDFVVAAIERALAGGRSGGRRSADPEWSQLSSSVFARDWESDEDRAYDDLPQR